MSQLKDFSLLSFDVYLPWTKLSNSRTTKKITRQLLLYTHHELESAQQIKTPSLTYVEILTTIHSEIAAKLGLHNPAAEKSQAYGKSIGKWPAFLDTVEALKRLSRHYKPVVLSNVDRESFRESNFGPLEGFPFDMVITAQDVGSYKPDPANFEYMMAKVKEKFGVEKPEILQTTQSQFHDHQTCKKMGIKSCWIARMGASIGNREGAVFNWKFNTLGEMANTVEAESTSSWWNRTTR